MLGVLWEPMVDREARVNSRRLSLSVILPSILPYDVKFLFLWRYFLPSFIAFIALALFSTLVRGPGLYFPPADILGCPTLRLAGYLCFTYGFGLPDSFVSWFLQKQRCWPIDVPVTLFKTSE